MSKQTLLKDKISIITRRYIKDERGWFLKILTGKEEGLPKFTGEMYITSAYPQNSKGGHYHKIANEWFTLIIGKAYLKLKDIITNEELILELDSSDPKTIFVPPYIAHEFMNKDDKLDFILMAYTDLHYDPTDTIPYSF
ncbi:MAG: WxcM-like domain-containing protein [Dysgonomonas sp.]|mgnify:CR=1 FL=1|nr:WxcM-like domain-containing protein [Dysgonomonas sp.]